jgi:hypothetical protein
MKSFATAASLALTLALAVPSVHAAPIRERSQVESADAGERHFDRAMAVVKRMLKRFGVRASDALTPPVPGPKGN